ncbi:kinase-like domain-containing protein [Gorgonomyces haynaldii]|nr:kinase-like domain-containing protein [Gorgonomyces haynaldii]
MGNCCKAEQISENAEVELLHFNLLRSVGKGAFGKVRVVQHKGTKKIFALKYINKEKCIQMQAVDNIIQERRLLEEIQNNFICNLRYAFQDDENLFMVIDLMLGGDLRFHLDRMGTFPEPMIQLIIAESSCGIAYLHSKNIVHRDLKPDNILLDEAGHAHLTDFNIAVRFKPEKPLTAVAGSMAYMAPEVLNKRGYFETVDWWSLGVIIYEVSVGKRPFRSKTNEGLTNAILHEELVYPPETDKTVSPVLRDLTEKFLVRDITKRLGCQATGGYENLKKHAFFASLDWKVVEDKKAQPAFVPDSKKANFDATHELEELLLEDNPLKAKARKKKTDQKPKEDETPQERDMRIMDEKFTVFDYTKIKPKDPQAPLEDLSNEKTFDRPDPVKLDAESSVKPNLPA